MATNKRGKHSFVFPTPPVITAWASIAGKKEAEGPLGRCFDVTSQDTYFGQKSWEQGEKRMQQLALEALAKKAKLRQTDFDLVFSGDLLNQCIGSSFTLRNTGIPHLGLYGACSTMAESLLMAAVTVSGGFGDKVVAMTSSHFASSERQYRFPLGYGGQRTPTSQWTVTGSGAALVCPQGKGPRIEGCTVGTVTDLGIKDANNMGAAMAPAAFETIKTHLEDFGASAADFDLIVTGDLGQVGKECLLALARQEGLSLGGKLTDCGTLVFAGAGRPRRRLRLRLQRHYPVRQAPGRSASRKAAKDPLLRNRRAAVPHFYTAGDADPRRLPCREHCRREIGMDYLKAFAVGGALCLIGQLLIDKTKLTPARILVSYVVIGVVLGAIGIYEPLVEFAGAGATVPLTGFGNTLAKGVREAIQEKGFLGIFTGGLKAAAGGITAAVAAGLIASFLFRPKDKS